MRDAETEASGRRKHCCVSKLMVRRCVRGVHHRVQTWEILEQRRDDSDTGKHHFQLQDQPLAAKEVGRMKIKNQSCDSNASEAKASTCFQSHNVDSKAHGSAFSFRFHLSLLIHCVTCCWIFHVRMFFEMFPLSMFAFFHLTLFRRETSGATVGTEAEAGAAVLQDTECADTPTHAENHAHSSALTTRHARHEHATRRPGSMITFSKPLIPSRTIQSDKEKRFIEFACSFSARWTQLWRTAMRTHSKQPQIC